MVSPITPPSKEKAAGVLHVSEPNEASPVANRGSRLLHFLRRTASRDLETTQGDQTEKTRLHRKENMSNLSNC